MAEPVPARADLALRVHDAVPRRRGSPREGRPGRSRRAARARGSRRGARPARTSPRGRRGSARRRRRSGAGRRGRLAAGLHVPFLSGTGRRRCHVATFGRAGPYRAGRRRPACGVRFDSLCEKAAELREVVPLDGVGEGPRLRVGEAEARGLLEFRRRPGHPGRNEEYEPGEDRRTSEEQRHDAKGSPARQDEEGGADGEESKHHDAKGAREAPRGVVASRVEDPRHRDGERGDRDDAERRGQDPASPFGHRIGHGAGILRRSRDRREGSGRIVRCAVPGRSRPGRPRSRLLPCAARPGAGGGRGAVTAAEKRDADAVVAFLAPGFRDAQGGNRDEAGATVRRYLAGYERLSLSISDLVVERGPGKRAGAFHRRDVGHAARGARPRGVAPADVALALRPPARARRRRLEDHARGLDAGGGGGLTGIRQAFETR